VGCGSFCRSWIAEAESPMVYVHELGHNLGMGHGATDPENDGTPNVEYGDASDPMGSSRKWHVFNAAHADQMSWFDAYPGTLVEAAAGGTFDLFPLAVHPLDTAGVRALKVDKPDTNESYYFSYRQPVGYDDSLSSTYTGGVSVHRHTGGSAHTHYVTTLGDGGRFEDPANGLTLTQLGRASDGSYVSVEVSFGCTPAPAAVSVSPSSQSSQPGASLAYGVSVTNQDGPSCAASDFDLAASLPAGLSGQLAATTLQLAPGATGSTTLQVTTAGEGRFDFSVDASSAGGSASGAGTAIADATPPSVPTLTGSVKRKNQVQLGWSASSDGSGSGVSAYRLHREGGSGGAIDVVVSGTSYTDRNTTSGASYDYTVYALDAVGNESGASNVVSLTLGGKSGGPKGGGGGGSGGGNGKGKNK
jgi:hypothetical protein